MFRGAGRVLLAVFLRSLVAMGWHDRAAATAYRSRARRLARDARGRVRRWGVSFRLNLNDNVQRTFYYTGWYERKFLEFLQTELRGEDTYVDVGAHVGIVAAFAARLVPNGSVVAFEPADGAAAQLRESLRGLTNVEVVAAGLGSAPGTISLHANPKWHRDDVATWSRYGTGPVMCTAPQLRFDDWAGSIERIDVVKIDVEGSELDVLRGMEGSLRRHRPRVLAVELYQPHLVASGTTRGQVYDYLAELGYEYECQIGENAIFRHVDCGAAPRRKPAPAAEFRPALLSSALIACAVSVWLARAYVVGDYFPGTWPFAANLWWLVILAGLVAAWLIAVLTLRLSGRREEARAVVGFIPDVLVLLGRLVREPRVSRRAKVALVLLAVYLAAPIDLIPDVFPVAGQIDEALFASIVLRWIARSAGPSVVRDHWPGPDSSLRVLLRVAVL